MGRWGLCGLGSSGIVRLGGLVLGFDGGGGGSKRPTDDDAGVACHVLEAPLVEAVGFTGDAGPVAGFETGVAIHAGVGCVEVEEGRVGWVFGLVWACEGEGMGD